jgi:hypothetical protein
MIYDDIKKELYDAKIKYPDWPKDKIHQVAIMAEESGESVRAMLNHVYHGEDIKKVREELIQTAAMCIRCIEDIDFNLRQMELF